MRRALLNGLSTVVLAAAAATYAVPHLPAAQAQEVLQRAPRVILDNWGYDRIYREGWSAKRLLDDATVFGPTGEEIGSVENIILAQDGRVLGIIAQVGGIWDIADTHVFVPWESARVRPMLERVTIPVTEENIEEYAGRPDYLSRFMTDRTQPVDDDLWTGAGVWKATSLINDYVYLRRQVDYGYVDDLIFRNGQLYAYVVNANAGWGGGYYALPYRNDAEWNPGRGFVTAPYSESEVQSLEPFYHDQMNQQDRNN